MSHTAKHACEVCGYRFSVSHIFQAWAICSFPEKWNRRRWPHRPAAYAECPECLTKVLIWQWVSLRAAVSCP